MGGRNRRARCRMPVFRVTSFIAGGKRCCVCAGNFLGRSPRSFPFFPPRLLLSDHRRQFNWHKAATLNFSKPDQHRRVDTGLVRTVHRQWRPASGGPADEPINFLRGQVVLQVVPPRRIEERVAIHLRNARHVPEFKSPRHLKIRWTNVKLVRLVAHTDCSQLLKRHKHARILSGLFPPKRSDEKLSLAFPDAESVKTRIVQNVFER